MNFIRKNKKIFLVLAMLLSLTTTSAEDASVKTDNSILGKMLGTSCESFLYVEQMYCCKHTFWIEHSCYWA